jgi:hypothetical protein
MADLSVNQRAFLDWLLDPRPSNAGEPEGKGSQNAFAKRHKMSAATLSKWKRDPVFVAAWEEKHRQVTGGIARYSELLEQLRKIALGEIPGTRPADMRAAAMNYMELTARYQPKKTLEIKDPSLVERDDKDLMDAVKRKLKVIEGGKAS